jgi:hypothetical protein
MSRFVAAGVLLLTIVLSGAAAGFLNGRWGRSSAVQAAAARLDRVPAGLGAEWDVQPDRLSDRVTAVAELNGSLSRRYVHRRTGVIVSVLLVCGRAGPVCVHTPEVCYVGAGFAPVGTAQAYRTEGAAPAQFEVRDFRQQNAAAPTRLRIFYAWGARGKWSAPAMPRLAFSGQPSLYKLYVVRQMNKDNEPLENDLAVHLLRGLLPQLQTALFSAD